MSAPAPVLAADLTAGLRRLKLDAMRELAPSLLVTAKTQRWTPEEVLRALVEAEITSRDSSNARARLKAAAFPVVKTLEQFDLPASSISTRRDCDLRFEGYRSVATERRRTREHDPPLMPRSSRPAVAEVAHPGHRRERRVRSPRPGVVTVIGGSRRSSADPAA